MGSSSDLSNQDAGGDARTLYGVEGRGASLSDPHALFCLGGLSGIWQVERVIQDARSGGGARLCGEARFTPDGSGLVYDEAGTLVLDSGQSFAATRRYLWRFDPIRVLFEDGRLFHTVDLEDLGSEIVHLCGEDVYRGGYRVAADHWETWWQVTGPRKDQLSRITYRR